MKRLFGIPAFLGIAVAAALLVAGRTAQAVPVPASPDPTPTVVVTIAVGSSPYGVGVNATTNRIYVANYGSDNVSAIDGATNRTYVANAGSNSVSVIEDLPPSGGVVGQVDLQGRSNDGGTLVQLFSYDHMYSDTTDAVGSFYIEAPPSGGYIAMASKEGYLFATRTGVVVSDATTTTLPTVTLRGGDADHDNDIDITDLAMVGANFGRSAPLPWA